MGERWELVGQMDPKEHTTQPGRRTRSVCREVEREREEIGKQGTMGGQGCRQRD